MFERAGLPNPKEIMKEEYDNPRMSWHYHAFASLSMLYPRARILEVGTWRGEFSKWLSELFPEGEVVTIDIKDHVEDTSIDFENSNLTRHIMDSTNMLSEFGENSFDLIWMDGAHRYPQCVLDFYQCRMMLKSGGVLGCDDIVEKDILGVDVTPYSVIDKVHNYDYYLPYKRINQDWKRIAIIKDAG